MNNDQIRRRILEVLYKRFMEDPDEPTSRDEMLDSLSDLEPQQVDSNVIYLEKSGYLEAEHTIGAAWYSAKILPKGVDLVEDKTRFDVVFNPTSNVQIIYGPVGPVIQFGGGLEVTVTGVDDLHKLIEERVKDRELVKDLHLKVEKLGELLQEDTLDTSRLSEVMEFFRTHAPWLVPIVLAIIGKALGT